ncbi:MAG TPA: erythromycin esterase [Oxalobacteraceae bacterium]|nr:erythromycin esterase [Oxalobacteraceae bacterium]HCN88636.1 erythromycin esterase [Oxalobacteraceae bacterium]
MKTATNSPISVAISSAAHMLRGAVDDYDSLLELIGDARFVLLGEASHGTHEFYQERARITQRLIVEKGFTAVAVEADWPDAYRVNRYVRGQAEDAKAEQALAGFRRFPTWMWRNADVVDFVEWLRSHNASLLLQEPRIGFYGLDLYSLFTSTDEVLRYLDKVDPEAARRARTRYACFDHFGENSQRYGYAASLGLSASCEDEVVAQLRDLQARATDYLRRDGPEATDAFFYAKQNARLVMNAEEYYRTMFHRRVSSWNLRDRYMAETLDALAQHLSQTSGKPAKIVVWEHNSHVGDARATEVGRQGEWNVGQLARELYGDETRLIGFTTYQGTVTAASDWDEPAQRKRVRPALAGSYEETFHQTGIGNFMLPLRKNNSATQALFDRRLERAIGVIYRPETERQSHYFYAHLPQQFDAVLHFDETHAVEPLEPTSQWETGEAPETFPVGV